MQETRVLDSSGEHNLPFKFHISWSRICKPFFFNVYISPCNHRDITETSEET